VTRIGRSVAVPIAAAYPIGDGTRATFGCLPGRIAISEEARMANISVGGASGGKRAVDSEIPLVPFIDLLLCCVMFLLVTAVWNQLAVVEARAPDTAGPSSPLASVDTSPTLALASDGWQVSSGAGDRVEGAADDVEGLARALASARGVTTGESIAVAADDDVGYERLIGAIDLARGSGFRSIAMADSAR
jgi:biopolymer transport protein ExbD